MSRILIVSNDVVDRSMAGPGIRAWEFATALSGRHRVTLAAPNIPELTPTDFEVVVVRSRAALASQVRAADTVVCQGPRLMPVLFALIYNRSLVVDLYDPYNVVELEAARHLPQERRRARQRRVEEVLNLQLLAGDFFLCASERQRDYWLGELSACGRLDVGIYDDDPTLRNLVDVVPFGLPSSPPRRDQGMIKGIMPGVDRDDIVVLWGGGLWGWLDPLTPIRAMATVSKVRSDVKLVFMGTRHPNPTIGRPPMVDQAIGLARDLGLLGTAVLFNEGWVPYAERDRYLTDADIGISAHLEHLETRFAFRTRLLDYLWTRLPIVCSSGDDLGDTVQRMGLGEAVQPGDVSGMAQAILGLCTDPARRQTCRDRLEEMASHYTWNGVISPLSSYCEQPARSKHGGLGHRAALVARIVRFYSKLVLDRNWSTGY